MAQQDGKTLKSSRKPSPANEQPVTPAGIWRVTRRPIRLGRGSRYPIQSRTAAVGPAPAEGWRPGRAGGGVPLTCRRLVRGGVVVATLGTALRRFSPGSADHIPYARRSGL